jgi:hypothetical protein
MKNRLPYLTDKNYQQDFHNKHDKWYEYYDSRFISKIKKLLKFLSKKIDEFVEKMTDYNRFIY